MWARTNGDEIRNLPNAGDRASTHLSRNEDDEMRHIRDETPIYLVELRNIGSSLTQSVDVTIWFLGVSTAAGQTFRDR